MSAAADSERCGSRAFMPRTVVLSTSEANGEPDTMRRVWLAACTDDRAVDLDALRRIRGVGSMLGEEPSE